ncbi:hypothetical protein C5167_025470 [Papaver somniferum]|uniref:Uncharacterized protein n=1 Tax=Papaver somniferum TaxID=3469 RepID=A0A4Y7JVH7_PAPSO|nr:uncharacterized protein LOC113278444 [Papaver somniferum]RZC63729.1 hypothetical protein C5167_025470 [Papaver somniferum]
MQQTTILKFTPTFHHPSGSSMIKKPQIHYTNFPNIHKITSNKPFHDTSCPKICITNKPFHISSCSKKDNADANSALKKERSKNSTSTTEKKLQLNVSSAFDPILSAVKRVFSSVTKLVSPYRFVVENDLILFKYSDEKEIVGVVQHIVEHHHENLMDTTVLCELGLLENFKISVYDIINQTLLNEEENEKMWRICTSVECKDRDWKKMVGEIEDILNAHDDVKCNSTYNFAFVNSFEPEMKIAVSGFVTVSKLRTPRFEHYMEVRKKVLSEIDEIRIKHGGSKEESALGDRVKLIRSR